MNDIRARQWLLTVLSNTDLPGSPDSFVQQIIWQAEYDGVLTIVDYLLPKHSCYSSISNECIQQIKHAARQSLLSQLHFYAEQKTVFGALTNSNIKFIVMKGSALGSWLYDSPSHREITDIDIWVAKKPELEHVQNTLLSLGYTAVTVGGELTSFEQAFDKQCHGQKIRIDVHWSLFNSAVLSTAINFNDAYDRSMTIEVQGQLVNVLSVTDALINSIGHRSMKYLSHYQNSLKWLYDQHLLFNALNAEQWQQLIERCAQVGISDLALDAIEQSQKTFKTDIPLAVIDAMLSNRKYELINRKWFQSWPRYQWHEMCAVSPKYSIRLKWLSQKLWPNPESIRERNAEDNLIWKLMLQRIGVGLKRLFG